MSRSHHGHRHYGRKKCGCCSDTIGRGARLRDAERGERDQRDGRDQYDDECEEME